MRPSIISNYNTPLARLRRTEADTAPRLQFAPFEKADIATIKPMLEASPSRTCDFTTGGIYLWADLFDYTQCVVDSTLFIKGLNEADRSKPAFSLPVGKMPLVKAIEALRVYCRSHHLPLQLSAVPEDRLDELRALGAFNIEPIADWADYLYDIHSLATFSGKKMSKKRNHTNRFATDNPDAVLETMNADNAIEALTFMSNLEMADNKGEMAYYERNHAADVLRNFSEYPFEGAILRVPGRGIVAFAVGEVVGDTLHVHIEKMDHTVAGAGETICMKFAAMMAERYPQLQHENRQDDSGDPGLRQGKLSYHPTALLMKYNLELSV